MDDNVIDEEGDKVNAETKKKRTIVLYEHPNRSVGRMECTLDEATYREYGEAARLLGISIEAWFRRLILRSPSWS